MRQDKPKFQENQKSRSLQTFDSIQLLSLHPQNKKCNIC